MEQKGVGVKLMKLVVLSGIDRAGARATGRRVWLRVALLLLAMGLPGLTDRAAGRPASAGLPFPGVMAQASGSQELRPEGREVTFPGHQVKLAGTILAPVRKSNATRLPAALIVGEMATTTRDEIAVGTVAHPVYRDLAVSLANGGVVSLRFDRRCRGASECKAIGSYDDYIDDIHGALRFLQAQPEVDPARIVLIGHGEGGYLATSLIAQRDDLKTGLIVIGMSGRTIGKMLRDEFTGRMTEAGRPPAEINAVLRKTERITRALLYNRSELLNEKFDERDPYDSVLRGLLTEMPRTVSLMVNDPLQALIAVRNPILILQGERDLEVTLRDSGFLEESLKRTYHPDFTVKILAEMDHLLMVNREKATYASYLAPTRPTDPQLLSAINQWIASRYIAPAKSPARSTGKTPAKR
jgi:pimeloyl-ACP methyl ester carboxylesterase